MGNHTASAEGGAYTARARMRSAGRATATATPAALPHPLETPAVHAPTSSAQSASPRQPTAGGAAPPKAASGPRNTVASSAALAFHRANRPPGSRLNTIGPGLYRLSMPGEVARVVTGQDLNAAFREASRANRQGMRTQARGLAQSLRPTKATHGGKGEHGAHGNILHDALHLYHRTLHTLGHVMG